MEYRPFGPTGRKVSIVGQGTWFIEDRDRKSAIEALQQGLDVGMNHIDTAEMYGSGDAELLIGEAIHGRREEVFLVSKVLPQHASRSGTVKACEASLARLKTDRLDAYLLYWRGSHPLEETIAAFEDLQAKGKIMAWGVSNFDVPDLEDVWQVADDGHLVCNQVMYHLEERAVEHAVLPWCQKHKVATVAYSPFGHDRFPGPQTKGGRLLQEIAEEQGATPRQVALQFLLHRPSVFAIPKSSTPEHASENAGAANFQLSIADIDRIDRVFPRGERPDQLPIL